MGLIASNLDCRKDKLVSQGALKFEQSSASPLSRNPEAIFGNMGGKISNSLGETPSWIKLSFLSHRVKIVSMSLKSSYPDLMSKEFEVVALNGGDEVHRKSLF